jgi:hypothetical protein
MLMTATLIFGVPQAAPTRTTVTPCRTGFPARQRDGTPDIPIIEVFSPAIRTSSKGAVGAADQGCGQPLATSTTAARRGSRTWRLAPPLHMRLTCSMPFLAVRVRLILVRKPQWLIKDVYLSAVFESEPAIPDN